MINVLRQDLKLLLFSRSYTPVTAVIPVTALLYLGLGHRGGENLIPSLSGFLHIVRAQALTDAALGVVG